MKITGFTKDVENISKLPDKPNMEKGYTAEALKAVFDKAGADIKEYINMVLIEELASAASDASGADKIGSGAIDGVEGDTVQEKLTAIAVQIKELINGNIPDASVSPDKFSPEIADFLTSASIRAEVFTEPGTYSFVPSRAGIYKITLVGGGGGGGVDPSYLNHQLGGGGGACAILWHQLESGDMCTITVGEGGEGLEVTDSALVSHAKAGGTTSIDINGETVALAEGAPIGLEKRAKAEGGSINQNGGYPKAGDYYGTTGGYVEFSLGGDSPLGEGAAFENDTPGIGGGGFCGRYYGSGIYSQGYKGGNGAAIIEYMK